MSQNHPSISLTCRLAFLDEPGERNRYHGTSPQHQASSPQWLCEENSQRGIDPYVGSLHFRRLRRLVSQDFAETFKYPLPPRDCCNHCSPFPPQVVSEASSFPLKGILFPTLGIHLEFSVFASLRINSSRWSRVKGREELWKNPHKFQKTSKCTPLRNLPLGTQ